MKKLTMLSDGLESYSKLSKPSVSFFYQPDVVSQPVKEQCNSWYTKKTFYKHPMPPKYLYQNLLWNFPMGVPIHWTGLLDSLFVFLTTVFLPDLTTKVFQKSAHYLQKL